MTDTHDKCKFIFEDNKTGVKIVVIATEHDYGVRLTYKVVEGIADLNGLFIDFGGDGGPIRYVGSRANNMNGVEGGGFDKGFELGSVGGNDADVTEGRVKLYGKTLEDIEDARIGIRATSVGADREDSLKLVATCEPHNPEPPKDHFPDLDKGISNFVFIFDTDSGDTKPAPSGDGFYTVKIDNFASDAVTDLDDIYQDALAYVIANDPNVDSGTDVLGVLIKYGQNYDFFDIDNNPNDSDTVPTPPGPVANNAIDTTYQYQDVIA